MKHIETEFSPTYIVQFEDWELSILFSCSKQHYDFDCKALSSNKGWITGMINWLATTWEEGKPRTVEGQLTRNQVQLLVKVLELRDPSSFMGTRLQQSIRRLLEVRPKTEKAPSEVNRQQ